MKKVKITLLAFIVMAMGMLAFNSIQTGSIKGTINPAEGGNYAWAISGTDTLSTGITQGAFVITDVKPGTYRLIIQGVSPYKNATRENVEVKDGEATDVGEIMLEQMMPMKKQDTK